MTLDGLLESLAEAAVQRGWLKKQAICRDNDRSDDPHRGEPYLHRYILLEGRGSWGLFLHNFVGDDPGPELHDHPWDLSVSLVLSGGYVEHRWHETRVLRPARLNFIRGEDFHRVQLMGRPSWTLFWHGDRVKTWGFKERERGPLRLMQYSVTKLREVLERQRR